MKPLIVASILLLPHSISYGQQIQDRPRAIKFSRQQVRECGSVSNTQKCLGDLFGSGFGYETIDDRIIVKVTLPKSADSKYQINGINFRGPNLSIQFPEGYEYYSVCGVNDTVLIGNFQFAVSGGCICGFTNKGKFEYDLPEEFSFIPKKSIVLIDESRCRTNRELSIGELKIIQGSTICGFTTSKGIHFYKTEEGVEFIAPDNCKLETEDGTFIGVFKGGRYVTQSTKEKPCNWRPATYVDPKYQKSD